MGCTQNTFLFIFSYSLHVSWLFFSSLSLSLFSFRGQLISCLLQDSHSFQSTYQSIKVRHGSNTICTCLYFIWHGIFFDETAEKKVSSFNWPNYQSKRGLHGVKRHESDRTTKQSLDNSLFQDVINPSNHFLRALRVIHARNQLKFRHRMQRSN